MNLNEKIAKEVAIVFQCHDLGRADENGDFTCSAEQIALLERLSQEAAAKVLSALVPADVSALVERLEADATVVAPLGQSSGDGRWSAAVSLREAASLIQSQAARIGELEAGHRPYAKMAEAENMGGTKDGESVIVNVNLLRASLSLLNGERKG